METTLEKIVSPPSYGSDLDLLCINTIRTLSADAVQKANSGQPGAPMGLGSYAHWDRKLDGRLAQAMCSIHASSSGLLR